MIRKVSFVSMFGLALSLSACIDQVASPEEANPDVGTGQTQSALSGEKTWQDTATLLCLDANVWEDVYTLGCNGGNFQVWIESFVTYGDQFMNKVTGECLDSNLNGEVYTRACNGGSFQQWAVRFTGVFGYEFRNVATGLCLDSNPWGDVYTLNCNGGNFQRWL